jgi:hypothetical protein
VIVLPKKGCQEGRNRKMNVSDCKQGKNNFAKVGGVALLDLVF